MGRHSQGLKAVTEAIEWPPIWESKEARKAAISEACKKAVIRDGGICIICNEQNPWNVQRRSKDGFLWTVDPSHILRKGGLTYNFAHLPDCISAKCRRCHDQFEHVGQRQRPQWLLNQMHKERTGVELQRIMAQLRRLDVYYKLEFNGAGMEFYDRWSNKKLTQGEEE